MSGRRQQIEADIDDENTGWNFSGTGLDSACYRKEYYKNERSNPIRNRTKGGRTLLRKRIIHMPVAGSTHARNFFQPFAVSES
jgi:hypothetical protein